MPEREIGEELDAFVRRQWISRGRMVTLIGIGFSLVLIGYDYGVHRAHFPVTLWIKLGTILGLALVYWIIGRGWFQRRIIFYGPIIPAMFIAAVDWAFHIQGAQAKPDRVFAYAASTFVIFYILPMRASSGVIYLAMTYGAYFGYGAIYGVPPFASFGTPYLLQALVIVLVGVIGNRIYLDTKRKEIEATLSLKRRTEELSLAKSELEGAYQQLQDSQKALVRAESLATIGSLVDGAAHELRNPLGSSGAVLESLLEEVRSNQALPEATRTDMIESIEVALAGQRRAAAIVNRLYRLGDELDAAGSMAKLGVFAHALRERYSDLRVEIDPAVAERAVAQVVVDTLLPNLIDNAYAAGGDEPPQLVLREMDGMLELCVEDSGCGISREIQDKVFKPFFTTEKAGGGRRVGLGLYIVHELVERLGGEISLDSTPGHGTRLRIIMPLQ